MAISIKKTPPKRGCRLCRPVSFKTLVGVAEGLLATCPRLLHRIFAFFGISDEHSVTMNAGICSLSLRPRNNRKGVQRPHAQTTSLFGGALRGSAPRRSRGGEPRSPENTAPSSSWQARVEGRRVTPSELAKPASMANLTRPSACEMPANFACATPRAMLE